MSTLQYLYFLVLFTFLTLISQIQSLESFYLSNLDKYSTYEDVSMASSNVQAIPKLTYKEGNITFQLRYSKKIEEETVITFLLEESHSILIDSVIITKDNKELTPNEDYSIYPLIHPAIIPNNYYEGFTEKHFESVPVYCSYINILPTYKLYSISKEAIKSIIHTKTMNFGIDDTNEMKLISFQGNSNSNKLILEDILFDTKEIPDDKIHLFEKMGLKKFKKLFLLTNFYMKKEYFAALNFDKKEIYFFEVNAKNRKTVIPLGICVLINGDEVTQVGMKENKIFLGTNNGLKYGDKSGVYYILDQNFIDSNKNIIDLIVNRNTVYVINNVGLHIFDIKIKKYTMLSYIKHPLLKKLDYVPYNINKTDSLYYIGIAVDNNPGMGYPEIFIEIVPEGENETMPSLNRVYTTNQDIKIEDMVTDYELGYTYIFDRETFKLYLLKRGIPFVENTFSYSIDLSSGYTFTKPSIGDTNKDYITMITSNSGDNKHKNKVVIMDKNGIVFFDDLEIIPQAFSCNFRQKGVYSLNVSVATDCSFIDENTKNFIFQACKDRYNFNYTVENVLNLIGLWISLGIIITLIICGLLYLFFFRSYCNKNKNSNKKVASKEKKEYSIPEVKHEEIVEVQIDNSNRL